MEQFIALSTLLLAVSLATERLVTIIKTLLPSLLIEEKTVVPGMEDPVQDKWRRFVVQFISFACAWFTSSFLTGTGSPEFFGFITVKGEGIEFKVSVVYVALLSMGGSALWSNLLGYAKAVKDIRTQERSVIGTRFKVHHRERAIQAMADNITTLQTRGIRKF